MTSTSLGAFCYIVTSLNGENPQIRIHKVSTKRSQATALSCNESNIILDFVIRDRNDHKRDCGHYTSDWP